MCDIKTVCDVKWLLPTKVNVNWLLSIMCDAKKMKLRAMYYMHASFPYCCTCSMRIVNVNCLLSISRTMIVMLRAKYYTYAFLPCWCSIRIVNVNCLLSISRTMNINIPHDSPTTFF